MVLGPLATVLPAIWISSTLACAIVTLRIYTRTFLVRSLGWDDFAMFMAVISSLGLSLIWSFQLPHGLGLPLASTPPQYMEINVRITWAGLFPYYAALSLVKISALLQMLRIFPIPRVRSSCLILLAFVFLFGIWTLISALITCQPLAYMWNKSIPGGHCIDPFPIFYANAGVNIATDVLITLLPLRILSRLRLTLGQKRGLTAVFALGLLAAIPSILRLQSLTALHRARHPTTQHLTKPLILTTAETNATIILACIPSLGPVLSRLRSRLRRLAGRDQHPPRRPSDLSMALSVSTTLKHRADAHPGDEVVLWPTAAIKHCGSGGIVVCRRESDFSDLTDLAEFAGFAGLAGRPDEDGGDGVEEARWRRGAVGDRWVRPDTGSTVVGCGDDGDEGRDDDGVSVGRASSTIGIV